MSVIIDQFEVILDSQQDREQKFSASETPVSSQQTVLKPHDIAATLMQFKSRCDRVRAH